MPVVDMSILKEAANLFPPGLDAFADPTVQASSPAAWEAQIRNQAAPVGLAVDSVDRSVVVFLVYCGMALPAVVRALMAANYDAAVSIIRSMEARRDAL